MTNQAILHRANLILFCFFFYSASIFAQTPKPRPVIPHETSAPSKKEAQNDSSAEKENNQINQQMFENDIRSFRPMVPNLLKSLKNKNHEKRLFAIEFLGKAGDLGAIDSLIPVMKSDSIAQVRAEAVAAVGMIAEYHQYRAVIPEIATMLEDSSVRVKMSAARALYQLGETVAPIPVLENVFCQNYPIFARSDSGWIRTEIYRPDLAFDTQLEIARRAKTGLPVAALELLTKIGTDSVRAFLIRCKQSPDPQIRKQAQKALLELD